MKTLFLFISFFYVQLYSFAQQKAKEYYPIYVNHHDYTVKTNIVSKNKKIKANTNLTYHWYSSNKIQETMGGYDGKMLHGQYASFYLNGNLKEKGDFKMGLKNGDWTSWYENGKIKDVTSWRKGLKEHNSYSYNTEGELVSKVSYRNNKQNGMVYNYKNDVIFEKKKYKNGVEIIEKEKTKEIKEPKDNNNKFKSTLENINTNVKKKFKKEAKNKEEETTETKESKGNRKVKKTTKPKSEKEKKEDKNKTNKKEPKEKTDMPPIVSKKSKKAHTTSK